MAAVTLTISGALIAVVLLRFILGIAAGLLLLLLLGIGAAGLVTELRDLGAQHEAASLPPTPVDCAVYPLICEGMTREYNALHLVKRPLPD